MVSKLRWPVIVVPPGDGVAVTHRVFRVNRLRRPRRMPGNQTKRHRPGWVEDEASG